MHRKIMNVYASRRLQLALLIALASSSCVHSQLLGNLLGGLTGGFLQPGTPAVYTTGASNAMSQTTNLLLGGSNVGLGAPTPAVAGTGPRTTPAVQQQPLIPGFGWLFPVYTTTRRANCVVYEGGGNENLQQVAALFGLNYANVLADNQGVISNPNEPLAGRSVLLCGQNGPPRPVQATLSSPAPTPAPARSPAPAAVPAAGRPQTPLPRPLAPTAPVAPATPRPLTPAQLPAPPAVKPLVSPAVQKQALFQLKAVIDPKGNALKDWKNTLSHCTWVYVTCDANMNVVRLNMVYLGLEGKLPGGAVMKNLPHLKEIYMGGNELKGPLPADWADAIRPEELFLNDNQLSGTLPGSWGKMTSLKVLSLPYNGFTGGLPPAWGQLSTLEILKLNNNKLSGPVPPQWSGMKSISTVTLFNNPQMTGCVPEPWSGKGRSGLGYFQAPSGMLSSDIKDATRGTAIQGYCCKGWKYCV